jgi:hypothetical protein
MKPSPTCTVTTWGDRLRKLELADLATNPLRNKYLRVSVWIDGTYEYEVTVKQGEVPSSTRKQP